MFIGRKEELGTLAGLWRSPAASLVTCRGRRRIGKSSLVAEFARMSGAVLQKERRKRAGMPDRPPDPDKEIGDGRRNQATQGDWTGDYT